jgi:replication factor C subunit 3/5
MPPPATNFTDIGIKMFDQKYSPTQFEELIFQNDIVKARLEKYASGKRKRNLLLYGPYGTGKSTAARVIADTSPEKKGALFTLGAEAVNCSRFKPDSDQPMTLANIKTNLLFSGKKYPYAVLDEFDILTQGQQDSVRDMMDRTLGRSGFILTTNYLHRIDGAILSRCDVVELPALDPSALVAGSQRILAAENVIISDKSVLDMASNSQGDWRSFLCELEAVVEGIREKRVA